MSVGPMDIQFPESVEARGELEQRLRDAYDRLLHAPLDDLDFVLSDLNFHYTRRFNEYSGDISGRMLGALNAVPQVLPHAAHSMKDALLAAIPALQKPDGHFGVDQDLSKSINQERDTPILWGNGRLLLALAQCYQQKPDEQVLACAKKLGDYIISTRPYYGKKENFEHVGGTYAAGFTTCYPSWIDGLTALGQISGDQKYLDEAANIARLSLLDREFAGHHSHGRLTAYRGMLDLDRVRGTREFTDAVVEGCKRIEKDFLMPTGGVTEMFDLNYNRDEGCSEADWIRVNLLLWQATADTHHLDLAEDCLRNHLYATQFSNGGFGHHTFRTLKDGDKEYHLGGMTNFGSEAYWCCAMHATQLLAELAHWGVVSSRNVLYVTWLAEVHARVGAQVDVLRKSPLNWSVEVRDIAKAGTTLRLRVPAWAGEIIVNGESKQGTDGWLDIPLDKGAGFTAQVSFPARIRIVREKENGVARIYIGPYLYCLSDVQIREGFLPSDAVPAITLAAEKTERGGMALTIPILLQGGNGEFQKANLAPVSSRPVGGCRYLFKADTVDADAFAKLEEKAKPPRELGRQLRLMFACTGSYEVYVNGERVFDGAGWEESPFIDAFTYSEKPLIAVKVTTQDKRPGFIGLINAIQPTNDKTWTAIPCAAQPDAELLSNPAAGQDQQVAIQDLGAFGIDPWKHTSGQFFKTDAHWIWPEKDTRIAEKPCWLFRFSELAQP